MMVGKMMERPAEKPDPDESSASMQRIASGARRSGMLSILIAGVVLGLSGPARGQSGDAAMESSQLVQEAEELVRQAGKSNPVDSAKIRAAVDKLHDAVRINPRNDAAYVDLGFCYGVLHDGPTAVDMYLKATQVNPSAQ